MGGDPFEAYDRWLYTAEQRFTVAPLLDVAGAVLSRHGYPSPTGIAPVDLAGGLYRVVQHYPCH